MIAPRTRTLLLRVGAGVHLSIAALYSTHIPIEQLLPSTPEVVMRRYGLFTGARAHFNFFAPAVPTQYRAQFVLTLRDGGTREATITTDNSEANQRLATMFNAYQIPPAREGLVRSWAAYLLSRNPDALSVETRVANYEIPTVAEARAGKSAGWVELERTVIRREDFLVR